MPLNEQDTSHSEHFLHFRLFCWSNCTTNWRI